MNCCAIIVVYYPTDSTWHLVAVLCKSSYIGRVVIVDNTPENDRDYSILNDEKLITILNEDNMGLGYAQNQGMRVAIQEGYEWACTFDQDSRPRQSLFDKYNDYVKSDACNNVGIVSTDYFDDMTRTAKYSNKEVIHPEVVISSGSMINIPAYISIGGFKEAYFIDQIDNEFCYRMRKNGFTISVLPGTDMVHSMGNIKVHNFFGCQIVTYNQNPIRTYYRTRNIIWMMREYKDWTLTKNKIKILLKDIPRILIEEQKLRKFKMLVKGLKDGLCRSE